MGLFKKSENQQAYLKMGLAGFAGSGKTTTAVKVAAGLTLHQIKKGVSENNKIYFMDTECGSSFIENQIKPHGMELFTVKSRAFSDLLLCIDEAEKNSAVLIIDSVTHFWKELITAYRNKVKGRSKYKDLLMISDWGNIKEEWGQFVDKYVNSHLHIIACGRAGYEYEHFKDQNNRKQLAKSGIKMKAEGEFGYEASLLVYMERKQEFAGDKVISQWREAQIWKDRSDKIDGKIIKNPSFKDFLPHIEFLNLGQKHVGVDTTRNSEEMFEEPDTSSYMYGKLKKVALEELDIALNCVFSASRDDKTKRNEFLQECFGTASKTAIENADLGVIKTCNQKLSAYADKINNIVKKDEPEVFL